MRKGCVRGALNPTSIKTAEVLELWLAESRGLAGGNMLEVEQSRCEAERMEMVFWANLQQFARWSKLIGPSARDPCVAEDFYRKI